MTIADLKKYARKGIRGYIDEWRELAKQGVVREEDAEKAIEELQKDYLKVFNILNFD